MTFGDRWSQTGRRQRSPALSEQDLYELETRFLEHSIRCVERDLEQIRNTLGTTYVKDGDDPSPGELQLLAAYEKKHDILRGLLAHPRRRERGLERLLGDWLRRADDRLVDLARTVRARGGYDAAFWNLQRDHSIRTTLLRDWWHWLYGNDHENTPGGLK